MGKYADTSKQTLIQTIKHILLVAAAQFQKSMFMFVSWILLAVGILTELRFTLTSFMFV